MYRLGYTESTLLFIYYWNTIHNIDYIDKRLVNWLYSTSGFYDKKIEQKKIIEYTDFVSLVVYPRLITNTPKKSLTIDDKFILLLCANDIANDAYYCEVNTKSKELVVRTFLTRKTIGDKLGKYLGKDFLNLMLKRD